MPHVPSFRIFVYFYKNPIRHSKNMFYYAIKNVLISQQFQQFSIFCLFCYANAKFFPRARFFLTESRRIPIIIKKSNSGGLLCVN